MADVTTLKDFSVATLPDGEEIKLNQQITYRTTRGQKSKGKVTQFRYADKKGDDKSSVWMYVTEKGTNEKDWISLNVHYEHKKAGFFK